MHCSTYCCFFLPILNPVNAVPFLPSPHCLLPPFSSSCLFSFSLSLFICIFFLLLPSSCTGTSLKRGRHAQKTCQLVFPGVPVQRDAHGAVRLPAQREDAARHERWRAGVRCSRACHPQPRVPPSHEFVHVSSILCSAFKRVFQEARTH